MRLTTYLPASLTTLLFLLLLSTGLNLWAGGPIGAVGDRPIVWDMANDGPVKILLDRGDLGQFDSAEAYDIITQAINGWDTVEGSILKIEITGYFQNNVTVASDPAAFGPNTNNDGIVPVVFDDEGAITDAFLGNGASNSVRGFANPFSNDGEKFSDGRIVLNGKNKNRGANGFVQTTTHELGHLVGLSHTQRSLRANYTLMNPFSGTMDEDDFLAIVRLYPDGDFLASRGGISGTITNPDGSHLSGVNVIAVDSASGRAYATLSDYFSGGAGRFTGQSIPRRGAYNFEHLPPGTYFLRMEGVDPDWTGGSSIASYDPPVNSELIADWYNGAKESGAMHVDNLNERVGVVVGPGERVEGIDFVQNDTTGLTFLSETTTGANRSYNIPQGYQGVTSERYGVKFRAPEAGSPVMVRFYVSAFPSINQDQNVVVTVHRNSTAQAADLPGTAIGSVSIPYGMISAGNPNDVWLHEISGLRLSANEIFHISLALDGPGRLNLEFFDGDNHDGTSYYNRATEDWAPFPIEGNNGGVRTGRLRMEAWYSKIRPGDNRVLTAIAPDPLQFDPTEVSAERKKTFRLASIGNVPFRLDKFTITGAGASNFEIEEVSGLPLDILPGTFREFEATFRPTGEGDLNATLEIDGNVPTTLRLLGTGTSSSIQQITAAIDFGQQLLNEPRQIDTVVIYNRGDVGLLAKRIVFSEPGFRLVRPTSDGFFRPGDSLSIVVEFEPTEKRVYNTEMAFTFQPARDTVRIAITGEGVDEITSVPVAVAASALTIGPNPVSDQLALRLEHALAEGAEVEVVLYDVAGREVMRESGRTGSGLWQKSLDVSDLPTGTYRLMVVTPEGRISRGVTVVR